MVIPVGRVRVLLRPLGTADSWRFFVPAAAARLGVAMTGLGLLLAVRGLTGSLADAGSATGAFALGEAVASPQWARLIDRLGQERVVPSLVSLHVACVGTALVSADLRCPLVVLLGAAAAAGASIPQPGAYSAARWTHVLPRREQLPAAFALDAAVNDVAFLVGPLTVTSMAVLVAPGAGAVLAAVILGAGCLVVVGHRASAPGVSRARGSESCGPRVGAGLPTRAYFGTVGVNVGLGCFFGGVPIIVTVTATKYGVAAATGAFLAAPSMASLISGLVYGSARRRRSSAQVQRTTALLLFGASAVAAVVPGIPSLVVALVLAGIAIAPLLVASSQTVELTVSRSALTQGFAWVNTGSAVGLAAASASVAVLVQADGLQAGALLMTVLVSLAPISALVGGGPGRTRRGGQAA